MEVTLVVRASGEEIAGMLDLLVERGYIPQEWGREVVEPLPLPGLEELPPKKQLTPKERAVMQLDLAGVRRQDISCKLNLTPSTVTVYRRNIRQKLRHLPPGKRSVVINTWLRRFPGRQKPAERIKA